MVVATALLRSTDNKVVRISPSVIIPGLFHFLPDQDLPHDDSPSCDEGSEKNAFNRTDCFLQDENIRTVIRMITRNDISHVTSDKVSRASIFQKRF